MDLLGQLLLGVDAEEPIRRQDEQIVILLNLMVKALWVRNYEFFERFVANRAADGDRPIYSGNAAAPCYEPILADDPFDLVLSSWVLVHRDLAHGAILLKQVRARIANVADRNATIRDYRYKQCRTILEPILARNLKKILIKARAN